MEDGKVNIPASKLKEVNDPILYWAVNEPKIEKLHGKCLEFMEVLSTFQSASKAVTKDVIFFQELASRQIKVLYRSQTIMLAFKDWQEQLSVVEKLYAELKDEMRGFLDFETPDNVFKEGMNMEMMREHVQADGRFANLDSLEVEKIEKERNDLNLIPQLQECTVEIEAVKADVPKDINFHSLWTGLN